MEDNGDEDSYLRDHVVLGSHIVIALVLCYTPLYTTTQRKIRSDILKMCAQTYTNHTHTHTHAKAKAKFTRRPPQEEFHTSVGGDADLAVKIEHTCQDTCALSRF